MTLSERARTWSIWDPVKPTSPLSCSLSVDGAGKVHPGKGVGHVFDTRYLLDLEPVERQEVGLCGALEFTSPLHGFALSVTVERRTTSGLGGSAGTGALRVLLL